MVGVKGAISAATVTAAAAAAGVGIAKWATSAGGPLGPPRRAPSGIWESRVSSKLTVTKSVRLAAVTIAEDGALYWLEGRPDEGGRRVVVRRRPNGAVQDITPPQASGLNVRTRVHEYGGGDYLIAGGACYFVNMADQQVYRQDISSALPGPAEKLTDAASMRFSDFAADLHKKRLVAVCEDHREGRTEPENSVVAIDMETGAVTQLVAGADFYSSPRVSRDGSSLCWVSWDHPSMPWDDTSLWRAKIGPDGELQDRAHVAGGKEESVVQPEWRDDGALVFLSDRSGWWNIYIQKNSQAQAEPLCSQNLEFGGPTWMFGWRFYCLLPGNSILASAVDPDAAGTKMLLIDADRGVSHEVSTPYTDYGFSLVAKQIGSKLTIACIGGSYKRPAEVAYLQVGAVSELQGPSQQAWTPVRVAMKLKLSDDCISSPRKICYPTAGGEVAYMLYYPPTNPKFALPEGEKPALLVTIHGGPTAFASQTLAMDKQFWTSRGFAVADIDYRGSTGYGRAYRDKLKKNWGITDVEDCKSAAQYLVDNGLADPAKLCITGGSAGGFTTLAALCGGDTIFKAGASKYGVADMELLAKETHKFESRYLDSLVGPYPEAAAVYKERSPLQKLDELKRPIIFYHGSEDKVVPPNQSEILYEKLVAAGVPTSLVMYQGESHGFRKDSNICHCLDSELHFYKAVLLHEDSASPMPKGSGGIEIANL